MTKKGTLKPRRTKVNSGDILIATETGSMVVNGEEYWFRAGVTRVRAGHPLALAAPEFFAPIDVHYDVEKATAAPGERRGE